jgi:Ca-activated chloride channel family protein
LPAADPQLQSLVVPLNAGTASYELTRRYLEGEIKTRGRKGKEGDWPPHDQVRTEDFINALNEAYDYPRPDRQALGLSIVAGPSPFRGPGYCLVQVGVQARSAPAQKRQPVHLVIAIDTSGSMQWGGRVEMVQRALRELIKQVEPDDRLSLVSFSDRAQVLVEDAGPAEVGHFLAAVDWLSAGGTTNSTAGLGDAFATAQQQNSPQRPARVVLLTDGLLELGTDPKVTAVLQQRVMDAAARGLPLHVIDLGQGTYTDPDLASLALSGQGTVHRAESAEQIRWSLQEILTGRSQIVAHGAQLKVAFNPKTVLEYRLLGYELGPGGAAPSRTDFRDGQSSTVLYEIRLALNAGGQVATAELMWYGMDANRPNERDQQRAARALDVKEFAASFDKAAPSLQAAALVAQTAEIFRRSPFVRHLRGGPTPMHLVEQMARQADSHLYQRAAFTEFLSMLELATKSPRVGQAGPRK